MPYCINCGKEIPDGSKFCPSCGTPVPVTGTERTERVAEPVRPVQPQPQPQYQQPTVANTPLPANLAFLGNIGFWGAVIMFISFFLPYYISIAGEMSMSDMVFGEGIKSGGIYLLLIFPISAGVIIIQAFTNMFPSAVSNVFKVLPLILLVFCLGAWLREGNTEFSFKAMMEVARVGFFGLLIGTILILFFKRKR